MSAIKGLEWTFDTVASIYDTIDLQLAMKP